MGGESEDSVLNRLKEPPFNSLLVSKRSAWRRWLKAHHLTSTGVWLVSYKKGSGRARISYEDSVEEALCFGWIDSKGNKLDELRTMLWFSPRKVGSNWSRINKLRVARLEAAGLLSPEGIRKVKEAKKDGSWFALDEVDALVIPPDLSKALKVQPQAAKNFDAFPPSAKRGILEWILNAKRPATRAARIKGTAALAAKNLRANQWKPK